MSVILLRYLQPLCSTMSNYKIGGSSRIAKFITCLFTKILWPSAYLEMLEELQSQSCQIFEPVGRGVNERHKEQSIYPL